MFTHNKPYTFTQAFICRLINPQLKIMKILASCLLAAYRRNESKTFLSLYSIQTYFHKLICESEELKKSDMLFTPVLYFSLFLFI